jgi:hypothetical protein
VAGPADVATWPTGSGLPSVASGAAAAALACLAVRHSCDGKGTAAAATAGDRFITRYVSGTG